MGSLNHHINHRLVTDIAPAANPLWSNTNGAAFHDRIKLPINLELTTASKYEIQLLMLVVPVKEGD